MVCHRLLLHRLRTRVHHERCRLLLHLLQRLRLRRLLAPLLLLLLPPHLRHLVAGIDSRSRLAHSVAPSTTIALHRVLLQAARVIVVQVARRHTVGSFRLASSG